MKRKRQKKLDMPELIPNEQNTFSDKKIEENSIYNLNNQNTEIIYSDKTIRKEDLSDEFYQVLLSDDLSSIENLIEQDPNLINHVYNNLSLNNNYFNSINTVELVIWIGNLDIFKLLLNKGANLKAVINEGNNALHIAAYNGRKEIVEYLIDDKLIDVNSINSNNRFTPLHSAAKKGKLDIIKLLIEKGANLKTITDEGNDVLHIAALFGRKEIVEYLIDNKLIDVNSINFVNYFTPLHSAAKKGKLDIIKLLIEKGANLKALTTQGNDVLHIAALFGHKEIVEFLLLSKSNIVVTTNNIYIDEINNLIKIYNDISKMNYRIYNLDYKYAEKNDIEFATKCFMVSFKSARSISEADIDNVLNCNAINQLGNNKFKIALTESVTQAIKDTLGFLLILEDEVINQLFSDRKSQLSIYLETKGNNINKMAQDNLNEPSNNKDILINSLIELFSVKENGYNYVAKNMALTNFNIKNSGEDNVPVTDQRIKLMTDNILKAKNSLLPYPKLSATLNNLLREYNQLKSSNDLSYIFYLESQLDTKQTEIEDLKEKCKTLENNFKRQQEQLDNMQDFLKSFGFNSDNHPEKYTNTDDQNFDNILLAGQSQIVIDGHDQLN